MIFTIFRKIGNLVSPGTFPSEESDDQKKWRQVNSEIKKKYRALGPLRYIISDLTWCWHWSMEFVQIPKIKC